VRSFTTEERHIVRASVGAGIPAGNQLDGSDGIVGRLFELLRSRSGSRQLRRIAVVVSKTDALRHTAIGQHLAGAPGPAAGDEAVRDWLHRVGWGNNTRLLAQNAGEVRYFSSGLYFDDDRADGQANAYAEPLRWLAGVTVNGTVQPATQRPVRKLNGNVATIPRGYRSGRVITLVTSMVAGMAATLFSTGTVIDSITGALGDDPPAAPHRASSPAHRHG
jgi:hypothetical protein